MIARDAFKFTITDEHFTYLSIQRGGISDLRFDRKAWEAAYHDSIFSLYESIAPFLPSQVVTMLDVGGGLGGIDALLVKHYGRVCVPYILDGDDEEPVVVKHDKPFNRKSVAFDFLRANGVDDPGYFTPTQLASPIKMDLIISVGSWNFHYPPEVYLDFVLKCCKLETILILDVRTIYPHWRESLARHFEHIGTVETRVKFERRVYAVK